MHLELFAQILRNQILGGLLLFAAGRIDDGIEATEEFNGLVEDCIDFTLLGHVHLQVSYLPITQLFRRIDDTNSTVRVRCRTGC